MADDILTVLAKLVAEDLASKSINDVTNSLDKLDTETQKVNFSSKDLNKTAQESESAFGDWQGAILGAATAFGALQIVKFIGDMQEQGEVVRQNTNTFNALSGSVSQAQINMNLLREATHGMVADSELMASASQLMRSGLASSGQEAAKLIGYAHDLGASTEELMSVLANQSTRALDKFGINPEKVKELQKQFESAGATSSEAFKEAFLSEAEKTVAKLGDSIEQNISPSEQLKIKWQNFWDGVSSGVANVLNSAITSAQQLGVLIDKEFSSFGNGAGYGGQIKGTPNVSGFDKALGLPENPNGAAFGQMPVAFQNWATDFLLKSPMTAAQTALSPMNTTELATAMQNLHDKTVENATVSKDLTDAQKEQAKAVADNTAKMVAMSGSISDTISKMMGWTNPQQRGVEGAERDVRRGLRRAGLTQEQLDQIMSQGGSILQQAASMGLDITNPQVIEAAYGVQGKGAKAKYVGQGGSTAEQLSALQTLSFYGGDLSQALLAAKMGSDKDILTQSKTAGLATSGQAFKNMADVSQLWKNSASTMPTVFGGMNYGAMGLPQNQLGAVQYTQRPAGAPQMMSPAYQMTSTYSAYPQFPQGLGMAGGETGGKVGGSSLDDTSKGLKDVADQAATVIDTSHMGGMPVQVDNTNDKMNILKGNLDALTGTPHNLEIVPIIKSPAAQDAFSKWVIEVLQKNGFNVK